MMLQKTFSVYCNDFANQHLFIELGYHHLACWSKKSDENKFSAFEFFQCDNYDASTFDRLINEAKLYSKLLTLDVLDTSFIWNTIENLSIPTVFAGDNFFQDNFYLITGSPDNSKLYQSQFDDVSVITKVDLYLNNAAQKIFPSASFYSGFKLNKPTEQTSANLFFYPNCFFIALYKNEKLLFAKSKLYTDPTDVLYFILNIIHQYNLEKNIPVIAGGLIDTHSKLFEMLYQYLEGFNVKSVNESMFASDEFKEYPSHYFLPYINYLA